MPLLFPFVDTYYVVCVALWLYVYVYVAVLIGNIKSNALDIHSIYKVAKNEYVNDIK